MVKYEGPAVNIRVKLDGPGYQYAWYSYKEGDEVPDEHIEAVNRRLAVMGEAAYPRVKHKKVKKKAAKKAEPKDELDLNGDGKVDKEDASIAGKVLAAHGKNKKE